MAFEFKEKPSIEKNEETGQTTVTGGLRVLGSEADFKVFVAKDHVDKNYPDRFKIPYEAGTARLTTVQDGRSYSRGERVGIANYCKRLVEALKSED